MTTIADYQKLGPDAIATYSGGWIRPLNPDPNAISLKDIAHSLSNQCRFTGHTREFYSTAQHSVLVSEVVELLGGDVEDCLWGLLHDASEAYISDIARPVKNASGDFRDAYRQAEQGLLLAVAVRFNLVLPLPDLVLKADDLLLWAEMRDLMPNDPPSEEEAYASEIFPWTPSEAKRQFLRRYHALDWHR